jgi:hypothetical protein
MTTVDRLAAYWSSVGVGYRTGVTPEQITQFEYDHGKRLTRELTEYFLAIDGMEDGDVDTCLLSFLPLAGVSNVVDELLDYSGVPDYSGLADTLSHPDEWFIIIDYMVRSHVYAVRLGSEVTTSSPVIWICGGTVRPMAESWTHFIDRYLEAPINVLFPPDI